MLSTLLGSETRARILRLLLSRRAQPFYVRELVREADIGSSGVQRELARLAQLGLVRVEPGEGGRRVIRVVDAHPLLEPLESLIAAEASATSDRGLTAAANGIDQGDVAARVNPHVLTRLAAVLEACHRAGVERAVLFGSATQTGATIQPHDIDLLVRIGGAPEGRGRRYFALRREIERISDLRVDLVEEDGIQNPYLQAEIERTGVVILETA